MSANLTEQLAVALGLEPKRSNTAIVPAPLPVPIPRITRPVVIPKSTPDQVHNDAEFARDNIYDVASKTTEAINELMQIAIDSQHPRAFEVLNQLLRTQAEATKLLLTIQKEKAELQGTMPGSAAIVGGNTYIANAVFVGTSSELLDAFHGRTREDSNDLE